MPRRRGAENRPSRTAHSAPLLRFQREEALCHRGQCRLKAGYEGRWDCYCVFGTFLRSVTAITDGFADMRLSGGEQPHGLAKEPVMARTISRSHPLSTLQDFSIREVDFKRP